MVCNETNEEATEDHYFIFDNFNDMSSYSLTNPCHDESRHYDISSEKGQDIKLEGDQ